MSGSDRIMFGSGTPKIGQVPDRRNAWSVFPIYQGMRDRAPLGIVLTGMLVTVAWWGFLAWTAFHVVRWTLG